MTGEPKTLDELLAGLEAIVGRLADPSAPLERLVADYEEGTRLLDAAQGRLDAAAERIARLEPGS